MTEPPELQEQPRGWNSEANGKPLAVEYVRQDDFTIALVYTVDKRLFVGATKQHPDDDYHPRTARLLALQRAQPLPEGNTVESQIEWTGKSSTFVTLVPRTTGDNDNNDY